MDDARTAPNADIWFSSQMRQRLIPPDGGAEGEYAPRAYGRLACLVLGVLAVHALVAGGLLFWPHERPAGGKMLRSPWFLSHLFLLCSAPYRCRNKTQC
ncbi:hypothetical protein [Acetobacter peroxydans]|jgi:hypothetical protein|uniref:hypothetical protein n=1 Tax=Acetobacter peroxydans TaxID=104098 RepID=UPI0023577076|nr:hypothetical protein [Acetobacter peroxydans]MCI1394685.1 hypothetical protein [Acetobacter peroxydans]MCI1412261.1 hypothetical protein [Acetobacter peroxydans]MCI1566630.1 hypothetical protein [Acetobacter peroxydans]MCI1618846.1 hypothetical protein [Acetobacter peroxydans]MCI1724744.1 hypothetical protein [Acetobacter peroxydans]